MKLKPFTTYLLLLAITLGSCFFNCTTVEAADNKIRFEAENAMLPQGSNAVLKSESGTSGENEEYIELTREIGEQRNSIIVFENALKVTEPGMYKLSVGFKTVNGDYKKQAVKVIEPMDRYEVDTSRKVLKNEKVIYSTKGEFQSKVWTEKDIILPMEQLGTYDIQIQGEWTYMDIDYIDVYQEKVIVNPEVDFVKFKFYRAKPEDLVFHYEDNYNTLQGLLLNGTPIESSLYTIHQENKEITIDHKFFLNASENEGKITLAFDKGVNPGFEFEILDAPADRVIFEAENATILGGTKIEETQSSQGKYIKIEKRGGVQFCVDIPQKGRYELFFRYRSPWGSKVQDVIIQNTLGEYTYGVGFPITFEEKDAAGEGNHRWGELKLIADLEKGINTITLKKQHGWMDIDYLRVGNTYMGSPQPIYELSTISPTQDIFYQSHPRDMYIHLEKNGHTVSTIKPKDGTLIDYRIEHYTASELNEGYALNKKTIVLPQEDLQLLPEGQNELFITFEDKSYQKYTLTVKDQPEATDFNIVAFHVDHGNATLLQLPSGKNLLIDSGKPEQTEQIIFPFLEENNIKLDYYMITHYHDDHTGYMDDIIADNHLDAIAEDDIPHVVAATQEERYHALSDVQFVDNKVLLPKDEIHRFWDLGGVKMTVLNSKYDVQGELIGDQDENNTSLALMIEYNGFKYSHGGDIYGKSQVRIMDIFKDHPAFLRADYTLGNHHFFGSIDIDFLRRTDAKVVFVASGGALFARGAFTKNYQEYVENYVKAHNGRLVDTILSCESGHLILRVKDKDNWSYETCKELNDLLHHLPFEGSIPVKLEASLVNKTPAGIDDRITIRFSNPLDPSTLNGSDIVLKEADTQKVVQSFYSIGGDHKLYTLVPAAPLKYDTNYEVEIRETVQDAGGQTLDASHEKISFKTDIQGSASHNAPKASLVNASPVKAYDDLLISFTSPMDAETFANNGIVLKEVHSQTAIDSAYSRVYALTEDHTLFTVDPQMLLEYDTEYEITLLDAIKDQKGRSLTAESRSLLFKTETEAAYEIYATPVPVTDISLDRSSITINEDEVAYLTEHIAPKDATNKEVIWHTSNPKVVSILGGKIVPRAPGKATITAATVDGNKLATCHVTINPVKDPNDDNDGGNSNTGGDSSKKEHAADASEEL
ncbi:MAG: Ig-like domain-containing protein [Firmicutes bacterium]|nr:Ig-like domain-containing protein [Bacillota bacterium]